MTEQLRQALEYHLDGIQLIPVPAGSKRSPCDFNEYLVRPQTVEDIHVWFGVPYEVNCAWASGVPSHNLLTLDVEDFTDYELMRHLSPAFAEVCRKTSVSRTGHGGVHVHVRLKETDLCRSFTLTYEGRKIGDGKFSGYCLEPHSYFLENGIHKDYSFIGRYRGILEIDSIESLHLEPFFSNLENARTPKTRVPLSSSSQPDRPPDELIGLFHNKFKKILEGDTAGYGTRSEAEFAFIVKGVFLGLSESEIKSLFEEYGSNDLLKYFTEKGDRKKRFQDEFQRASAYVNREDKPFDTKISTAYHYYKYEAGGLSDTKRRIILGILSLLREAGPSKMTDLGLSVRELALASRVSSISTVAKHLKTINIKRIHKSDYKESSRFDVTNLLSLSAHTSPPVRDCTQVISTTLGIELNSDISSARALGLDADIVLESLIFNTEKTIQEWATIWRVGYTAAKRKLRLLESVGVVELRNDHIKRGKRTKTYAVVDTVTQEQIDAICEATNTLRAKERQQRQYMDEREAWVLERAAWKAAFLKEYDKWSPFLEAHEQEA